MARFYEILRQRILRILAQNDIYIISVYKKNNMKKNSRGGLKRLKKRTRSRKCDFNQKTALIKKRFFCLFIAI